MANHYQLTYQDFKDAQQLYLAHRPRARFWLAFWHIGAPVIGLLAVLGGLLLPNHGVAPVLYPIGGWFLFMGVFQWIFRPFQLRRLFKKSLPDGQTVADVDFSFGEEGFRSAIVGRSEGRFFWPALQDYVENEKLALLFIKQKLFLYIPRRAMPEEEWQSLRQYVHEKTGKI